MLQLLLFGCIVFPLIAAVAVALDKEGTLRRRIVYAGTGITALSALGLALYGSFVLPISPDSSLQPLMTVLDLALLVFILYVAVNIRHRLSMGLALGQLAGMIYLDFFMLEGHQATAFLADPLALVMVLVISLVGGIVCIFGLGYMQEHEDHLRLAKSKQSRFFFFLLLFLGAMNGLVLCDSLTWVFFFWEITTLCSFFLISHDGTREAKRNATRALWMNMVGGIGFLAAMLFMQKAIGTLSIQAMLASPWSCIPRPPCCPSPSSASPRSPNPRSFPSRAGCAAPWSPLRPFPPCCTPPRWSRPASTLCCASLRPSPGPCSRASFP